MHGNGHWLISMGIHGYPRIIMNNQIRNSIEYPLCWPSSLRCRLCTLKTCGDLPPRPHRMQCSEKSWFLICSFAKLQYKILCQTIHYLWLSMACILCLPIMLPIAPRIDCAWKWQPSLICKLVLRHLHLFMGVARSLLGVARSLRIWSRGLA